MVTLCCFFTSVHCAAPLRRSLAPLHYDLRQYSTIQNRLYFTYPLCRYFVKITLIFGFYWYGINKFLKIKNKKIIKIFYCKIICKTFFRTSFEFFIKLFCKLFYSFLRTRKKHKNYVI